MTQIHQVDAEQFAGYARERLKSALDGFDNGDDVLAEVQLALMALHMLSGSTEPITLDPRDVVEHVAQPDPTCICPPGLADRGGFRSGCPVHHPWCPPRPESRTS